MKVKGFTYHLLHNLFEYFCIEIHILQLHSIKPFYIMKHNNASERITNMKKNTKQILAILSLIAIALLIILFVISAFFAKPGDTTFFALFFGIIAIPILTWVLLFCIGRFKGKHTIAELFPEDHQK